MAITSQSYFAALRDYLNTDGYEVTEVEGEKIVIKDKVYWPGQTKTKPQKVRLIVPGEALVINLDKKNNRGNSDPMFHFLEDESKPWAKRCDFVIFHLHRSQISAICIEFKSGSFPESLPDQMKAGSAWCRSLYSIIKHYTGKSKRLRITKYVLSCHLSPERFLDNDNKYLKKDHTIRHYHYNDIDGMSLLDLDNSHVETIG
ncbi:hypothetical protein HW115_08555 [Verrucomicrobiaceae bacterium N1E253]|uniref:Uncharacterized protein n=1 Tax=Oceaniferula marina TaxID=2748318 RepID=A0A851GLL3_9BACT|nr:hypothetical protein [Oceaniferula marina]NWK55660.1 hypothetical protein [Oceaniferula marina]